MFLSMHEEDLCQTLGKRGRWFPWGHVATCPLCRHMRGRKRLHSRVGEGRGGGRSSPALGVRHCGRASPAPASAAAGAAAFVRPASGRCVTRILDWPCGSSSQSDMKRAARPCFSASARSVSVR